jgi:dephospho-CoA kinase
MLKIGLTGNYYSGQHEVGLLFEELDVPVFDANLITKFLLNYSPKHRKEIYKQFGDTSFGMGVLNLTNFNSNIKFNKLLDIIELDLLKAYEKFRVMHKDADYTIFKYDFIFERMIQNSFDYNISCYRPKRYRKEDMQTLTNFSEYIISEITSNEMDELTKNQKSNFIIQNYNPGMSYNSDIVIGLDKQVKGLHKKIMLRKNDIISEHYY